MSQIYVIRCFLNNRGNLKSSSIGFIRQINNKINDYCISRYGLNQVRLSSSSSSTDPKRSNRYLEVKNRRSNAEQTSLSTDVRPLSEKIKENTKTFSYLTVILFGIGATAIMMWSIGKELLSSTSPNGIYSAAFERIKGDSRVQDALGTPIVGYGETTRRGRRQYVAHELYQRNGIPYMRMQFYIHGNRNKATVHLDIRQTSGKELYRYLLVQLNHYPNTTIILEDNRALDAESNYNSDESLMLASYDMKK